MRQHFHADTDQGLPVEIIGQGMGKSTQQSRFRLWEEFVVPGGEPMHAQGEDANKTMQKDPRPEFELKTFILLTALATEPLSSPFKEHLQK